MRSKNFIRLLKRIELIFIVYVLENKSGNISKTSLININLKYLCTTRYII